MATLDTIHLVGRYTFLWKTPMAISLPVRVEATTSVANKVTYEVVGDLPEGLTFDNGLIEGTVSESVKVTVRAYDGVTRVTRSFTINP